jgi:hypothetical protein
VVETVRKSPKQLLVDWVRVSGLPKAT